MSGYTVIKMNKKTGDISKIFFTINKREAFHNMRIQEENLTEEEKSKIIVEIWKSCGEVTEVIASYFTRECYLG